jgi:hypothetical protein
MKKLVSLFILFFTIVSCSDNNDSADKEIERLSKVYPKCVVDKIKAIYKGEFIGTTTVKKYSYNNEIVYEFDSKLGSENSEGSSFSILNDNCETICGGDSGIVYHNTCVDWDKATLIETVWKDPRK